MTHSIVDWFYLTEGSIADPSEGLYGACGACNKWISIDGIKEQEQCPENVSGIEREFSRGLTGIERELG